MNKYSFLLLLAGLHLAMAKLLSNSHELETLHFPSKKRPNNNANNKAQNRMIQFSGYNWKVRDTRNKLQGPGPNYFSNNQTYVWIDSNSHLHMKISQQNNKWYCSEVTSQKSYGYGSYIYNVDRNFDDIDASTVVGLFNYLDDTHEIDIQISRWGRRKIPNTQYVVQPFKIKGNQKRFNVKNQNKSVVHAYTWSQNYIYFQSFYADTIAEVQNQIGIESKSEKLINQYNYTGASNPKPSTQKVQINLWLYKRKQPSNGKDQEITIKQFRYIPPKQ